MDKHVVKMILEAAQLLSTAHRILDGKETQVINPSNFRKKKIWILPDGYMNGFLYNATHINHPSAVWARESNNNYNWLWCYLYEHCKEYTHRYGKTHKVESSGLLKMLMTPPNNIPVGHKTQPPQAMPDEYKGPNTVEAYRKYYKYGKASLHSWKKREEPYWMKEI